MLRRLIEGYFLEQYRNSDFVVQQKVKVLSSILLLLLGLIIFLYSYHLFLIRSLDVFLIRTFALIGCIVLLVMIRKGFFSLAGHLMLLLIFSAIWAVMFFDKNELLIKADTIVMAIGVFSSCALVLDKKKWTIFLYWVVNILLLAAFCYQIMEVFDLQFIQALEYFMDNFFTLTFIAIISYQVISINNLALAKANESIQLAESEVLKNKRLNETLEQKVLQRTLELSDNNRALEKEIRERNSAEARLQEARIKLVENAHKAGMAEIASDTLHNVGNILNSIKTSAHIIEEIVKDSPEEGYSKACDLIRDHQGQLGEFLSNDPKGIKVIEYFLKLDDEFARVFEVISSNTERLNKKIDTIADVIIAQQNYAGTFSLTVAANITEIIDDALAIIPDFISGQNINIIKEFQPVPPITIQKTKLLHTLVNLFKNAAQAMSQVNSDIRTLTIRVYQRQSEVNVEVSDTGIGIAGENLKKIFNHGFTTKNDGFGFGLHSCANYLHEMGASIEAQSLGIGRGATFILRFPV